MSRCGRETEPTVDGIPGEGDCTPEDRAKALPLWNNFSWTFAGTLVYTLCQWGMLSVLSKLGTPAVVGQFALGLAITAPIILFSNLQLRYVQATDARNEYAFGDYLGLRVVTTLLALVLILAIVSLSGYRLELIVLVLVVGLAKAFESVSDIYYGLLQRHERMDVIAFSMTVKGLLSLLALGLVFYLTHSLVWATVALAATWALILFAYDVPRSTQLFGVRRGETRLTKLDWNAGTLWKLTYLTLPLGFVAALNSLNTNLPRYLTEQYLGERELGIFASLAYVTVSARLISGALGNSASPRLARFYAAGDRKAFGVLLLKLLAIGGLAGVVGILAAVFAGRWILGLLYTPEYAGYTGLFVWIMVATAFNYLTSVLNFGLVATRCFRAQALALAGVVGVTGVACLALIPQLGILGAGVALTVGMAFYLGANCLIVLYALRKLGSMPDYAP